VQDNQNNQAPTDLIRDNENIQAQKILENLQKLFHNQKVQNYLMPFKDQKKEETAGQNTMKSSVNMPKDVQLSNEQKKRKSSKSKGANEHSNTEQSQSN